MGPGVEVPKSEKRGNSRKARKRHRRDRCFDHRPRGRHPTASAQVMHQHQRDPGERDAEPEKIAAEPGLEETGSSRRGADRAAEDASREKHEGADDEPEPDADRKSTRLNSSHVK